ncbi:MAG: LamG-like jellyroll fold domain-containing protein, partial [Solirubrobacteraceae bacterium]
MVRSLLAVVAVTTALLVLGSSVAYAEEALVGYWKFDEPVAGAPVADSSGNGGTGTPVNDPTPSSDVSSQIAFPDPYSLSFNGSDQYVAVPDPANHRYTLTSGTFSTWVKFNGWTGSWQDFIAKRTTGGGNVEYQWGYGTNSDGGNGEFKVTFASDGADGGNSCCTDVDYSGTQLRLGVWYFVAMSFDASSHTLKWYVNGTLEQTDDVAANLGFGSNTGADLDIGSSYDGTGEFMDGELDDTRIYNYVLSDDQIAEMADGQSGPNVNGSGALTDPEPVTSVNCGSTGWTAGSQSCAIDASEENVVTGDPDPPSVSSVWWSADGGQTWSQANGTSQTVVLPAGTAVTSLQAYAVDSAGTQGSTVTATSYQDDTPPTVAMATPSGALAGEQQLSGTVSLPALTQTVAPQAVGIATAVIQYRRAGQGQWQTACTISTPAVGDGSCAWDTTQVANGSYDLREIATDTLGNSGTSPVVQSMSVDNPPPSASIACSPATAGAVWSNTAVSCAVTGTAHTDGATITGISYADNAGSVTEVSGATGSFTPAVEGVNRLTATVTDSSGQTATATAVVLYDSSPPTATLNALAASLAGNVQLSGTAVVATLGGTLPGADSWPTIASVVMQYLPGGQNQWLTACTVSSGTAGGDACNWDTSAVPPGSYDVRERATDTVGNTAASAARTVAVNETPIIDGTATAHAGSAAGHRGHVFTLSAAGTKPAAGTTIR